MKTLFALLFLIVAICGCKKSASNEIVFDSDPDQTRWEAITKTTTSLDTLFEASPHINSYFPEEFHRLGDEKSYNFLISKLKSPDPKDRDTAAACFRFFFYGERDKQLIEAYKRETVEDVKLGILFAMCNTNGTLEIAQFLTPILEGNDNSVRWSAARSLSSVDSPEIDELLARFKNDPDPRVREEVAFHFEEKEKEIKITEDDAARLIEVAAKLIASDKTDRTIQSGLIPAKIGKHKVRTVKVYEGVLMIGLSNSYGGLIINPTKANIAPAINGYWIKPTDFVGVLKFECM